MSAELTEAQRRKAEVMAKAMPKDARRCILNWGDKKTPIPDSVWHGAYSAVARSIGPCSFVLSPLGLAVREILARTALSETSDE